MARRLKDWLKSYLEYTSLSESPDVFHFWVGISTLAGALRRRVYIDQRYFEWTPNFYIILVAPPGVVSKSTTIGIGHSLLREVEDIRFGPDSGTWQAIGGALQDAIELVPKTPGDFEGDMEEMSCITCAPGELGTFIDFQDRKLIDTLTSLWDGQRGVFEHKTKSSGNIEIKNPWINIISATTPSWLRRNVPEESIGGGFASRVVFVFGEKKRHLTAYPGLMGDVAKYKLLREDLLHDLKEISTMLGAMTLTDEAVAWGTEWYENHWRSRPIHMASDRFDGYLARKQTHIHKLAMVIAASQSSQLVVRKHHLEAAETITTATENDMIRVFESIGVAPMSKLMMEIVKFLHTYKIQGLTCTQKALLRHCYQTMSQQEFEEAITAATRAGYITVKQRDGVLFYNLEVEPDEVGRHEGES
jgi:histone H3/H4